MRDGEVPVPRDGGVASLVERRRAVHVDAIAARVFQSPRGCLSLRRAHGLRLAEPLAASRGLPRDVMVVRGLEVDAPARVPALVLRAVASHEVRVVRARDAAERDEEPSVRVAGAGGELGDVALERGEVGVARDVPQAVDLAGGRGGGRDGGGRVGSSEGIRPLLSSRRFLGGTELRVGTHRLHSRSWRPNR